MLRAISYLVRDSNWGTYRPEIANVRIDADADGFRVSYDGRVSDGTQALTYTAVIEGRSDGMLTFTVDATAQSAFTTNRAGFVVLHPIIGVAGSPVEVEEVDGRVVETRFPELIDPTQPFQNLRALTHEFAPGYRVTCRMEGDEFDFIDDVLWLRTSDGQLRQVALRPAAVARFYAEVMAGLRALGIDVRIHEMPNEIPGAVRFPDDHAHASYDGEAHRVLLSCNDVFADFRTGFLGKASPSHFFWGSFDLAVTGFLAPP